MDWTQACDPGFHVAAMPPRALVTDVPPDVDMVRGKPPRLRMLREVAKFRGAAAPGDIADTSA
jgi:hypothetical protein